MQTAAGLPAKRIPVKASTVTIGRPNVAIWLRTGGSGISQVPTCDGTGRQIQPTLRICSYVAIGWRAQEADVAIAMLCYCGRHLSRDEEGVLVCAFCKIPSPRCRCLPLGVG